MSIRNMFESIMSEEDAESGGDDLAGDGGDGLMAEEADDPDEEGDDLAGLGGLDDGGEELGAFDDEGFGEADEEGGEAVAELEHRLDELENEVGSLSSTVNTVRNENEQIAESVGEVEENVRKLLDIYEMVTRGVNPFADDVDAGMAGGAGGEGFGLFAEEEVPGDDEALNRDVAEADAEGFFEDDLVEPDEEGADDDGDVEDLGDPADLDDEPGEPDDESGEPDDLDDEPGDLDDGFEDLDDAAETGGTSFQDLKEEYESDESDWDDETEPSDEMLGDDDLAAADDLAADDPPASDEPPEEAASGEAAPADATPGAADADARDRPADATGSGSKPYLAALPSGVSADLIVVEWLEYLVGEAGVRGTARAIDYYESIDWVDAAVADDLQDYLAGFEDGGGGSLTIDHHTRSLEYIGQLNGGGIDAAALGRLTHGGGTDGVQR